MNLIAAYNRGYSFRSFIGHRDYCRRVFGTRVRYGYRTTSYGCINACGPRKCSQNWTKMYLNMYLEGARARQRK